LERAWNNQRIGLVLLGVMSITFVLVGLTLAERVVQNGNVLTGVRIGNISAGGMSEREALVAVRRRAVLLEQEAITVRAGDTDLSVDPTTIGLDVDARATVRDARIAGRSHNPVDQVAGAVLRRFRDDEVPLVLKVDHARFDAVLDAWVAQTGKGLVDGGLRFEGLNVVEVAPKSGTGIQRAEAKAQVMDALRAGESDAGTLKIGPTEPAVDAADVRRVARLARRVLSAPVTVTAGTTPIVLAPEQVVATMSAVIEQSQLVLRIDPAKLRVALGPPLGLVEVPPRDAGWAIDGATASVIPAQIGKLVDLEQAAREIASGNHHVTAALTDVPPARTTEWAQALNITELVGTYTTYHPSGQPRVENIHKAASVIDGTIVPPGETFSLNQALGPRTLDKGYVLAPGIGADLEYEDSVGGGVSQLSTTLYNATFFGCYEDVTHSVHALYISRYPMGREATLNYPGIDNQFRNDSSSGVLIKTYYSSGSITVSLYGNKGGRSCTDVDPKVLETIPSPPQYIDDPALPVGQQKTIAAGHTGYVVEYFRIISVPGQPDKRERYVEKYAATPTKIARGTAPPAPPPAAPVVPVVPPPVPPPA
jgi:vancomycin resistance protein YoaR